MLQTRSLSLPGWRLELHGSVSNCWVMSRVWRGRETNSCCLSAVEPPAHEYSKFMNIQFKIVVYFCIYVLYIYISINWIFSPQVLFLSYSIFNTHEYSIENCCAYIYNKYELNIQSTNSFPQLFNIQYSILMNIQIKIVVHIHIYMSCLNIKSPTSVSQSSIKMKITKVNSWCGQTRSSWFFFFKM